MEFEKGRPKGVERIKEIDATIQKNELPTPERNLLISEKRSLLINFTEQEIQELIEYTMGVLKNSRGRQEVESDIRHLITNLKENK